MAVDKLLRHLCGLALGLAACFGGPSVARVGGAEAVRQPVQYNHKVHAEELGVGCSGCHAGVETNRRAGFPPDEYCLACHSSPQSNSANEAELIRLLEEGKPLAWVQVTRLANHVLFSHQRHVMVANIDCTTCHGDMRAREVPIEKPAVFFEGRAGMFQCIGCHLESGSPYAGVDCVDCHR